MRLLQQGLPHLDLHLSSQQIGQFRRYGQEMADWNQRINLTAIVDPDQVQLRHFLDSLTACLILPPALQNSARLIDVGAGAGFPGIPLKIALPGLTVVLVESVRKKAAFLQHLAGALGLSDLQVLTGRAETLAHDPSLRHTFDVAVARALGPLAAVAELTLPFCKNGGLVIAYKKGDVHQEVDASIRAVETLGGRLLEQRTVDLPGLQDNRSLVVYSKVEPTPPNYPRRPGIPRKRPL